MCLTDIFLEPREAIEQIHVEQHHCEQQPHAHLAEERYREGHETHDDDKVKTTHSRVHEPEVDC